MGSSFFVFAKITSPFMNIYFKEEISMRIRINVKKRELTLWERLVRNLSKTWRNKLFAIVFYLMGHIAMYIVKDGTLWVFTTLVSAFIFFSKEDIWTR